MKKRWLPTMPLDVSAWLLDPEVRALTDSGRGRLMDELARSWIAGEAKGESPAFLAAWPALEEMRERHTSAYDSRVQTAKRAREAKSLGLVTNASDQPKSGVESLGGTEQSRASSSVPRKEPQKKKEGVRGARAQRPPSERDSDLPQKTTWVTPYVEAWRIRFDGALPVAKWVRALEWAEKAHGPPASLAAFRRMLDGQDDRWINPGDFQGKFGIWAGTREAHRPPRYPSASERTEAVMRAQLEKAEKADGTAGSIEDRSGDCAGDEFRLGGGQGGALALVASRIQVRGRESGSG